MAHINPWRYRGKYTDRATGFIYMQTRYYDPVVRQFINPDNYMLLPLLAMTGELNMQAYVMNNPIMYVDPTGMLADPITLTLKAIAAIVIGFVLACVFVWGVMTTDWSGAEEMWSAGWGNVQSTWNNLTNAWNRGRALFDSPSRDDSIPVPADGVRGRGGIGRHTGERGSGRFFAKDRFVESQKRGMSQNQREKFQREIEDRKYSEGRGGRDNLPKEIIREIARMIRERYS